MDEVYLSFLDHSYGVSCKIPLHLCVAYVYVCYNYLDMTLTSAFCVHFRMFIIPPLLTQTPLHTPPPHTSYLL